MWLVFSIMSNYMSNCSTAHKTLQEHKIIQITLTNIMQKWHYRATTRLSVIILTHLNQIQTQFRVPVFEGSKHLFSASNDIKQIAL